MARTRLRVTVGMAALLISAVSVSGASSSPAVESARCASGAVAASIAGKPVCLRRGQKCVKRHERQYHRYSFHCHSARLTGGPALKPQQPPSAGKVVATIEVPNSGALAIGAGSVWVASTPSHTVTRIDPNTNTVVATVSTGGNFDPFHGPSRLAFGHGTMWVLDGTVDCSCVHRIDPATNTIVATIRLGTPTAFRIAPLGIAVQPHGVWIAVRAGTEDAPDGSVIRVDPATNTISAIIGAGSSPDFGGPTGIAAEPGSVWAGVPSLKSIVRIDPLTNAVVATIPGMTCAEGQVAADSSGVWVADCDAVRRIDRGTNTVTKTVRIPGATGMGAMGIAVGLGSVWAQAGPLIRIDPASGAILGRSSLDASLVWGEYSLEVGFDSVWVRQIDSVVRIQP